jgi:hypothetical protein
MQNRAGGLAGAPVRRCSMLRLVAILAVAGGAALLGQPAPARAETLYPWCIQYAGGQDGIGAAICSFVSKAQCEQTAMGMNAMCMTNPAYPDVLPPRERRRRVR